MLLLGEWIKFFTGCGIPDDVAAMYSLIFCENRIQSNMLPDLNKEYLRDMGITVMGDIIAILRHAKTVHEKHLREEILSDKKSNNVPLVEPKTTPVKKTTCKYTLCTFLCVILLFQVLFYFTSCETNVGTLY